MPLIAWGILGAIGLVTTGALLIEADDALEAGAREVNMLTVLAILGGGGWLAFQFLNQKKRKT